MEHPTFQDPLADHRDRGLTEWRRSFMFGALPSHRCTVLELITSHDEFVSAQHLLMTTVLRDRLTGSVVSARTDICKALPLDLMGESSGHTGGSLSCEIYVREMCQMIAPVVRAHRLKMRQLGPVIELMNASWDLLGVFQEIESLDAMCRRKQQLLQEFQEVPALSSPDSPVVIGQKPPTPSELFPLSPESRC